MSNNIVIDLPDLTPVKSEVSGIVEAAKAVIVTTIEEREAAAEFERMLIKKERAIGAHYAPIKKSLNEHKKVILDQEREYLAPVKEARNILKQTQLAWDVEQERIAAEQRKKVEDELRRRREEEQLEKAEAAEKSGNTAKAEAVLDRPVETPKVKIEAPKMRGQSVRTTWKAEVADFPKLLAHIASTYSGISSERCEEKIATNPTLMQLVQPNEQAIRAMAREQKDKLNLPGVRVYSEKQVTTKL